jgi:sugar phosphate permease
MKSTRAQRQVFAVTWITYAGYYLCRKNLSVALPLLHGVSGLRNIDLANIVFGYSLFYAIGQFACGFLADRIGAKRVIGAGLFLVVASNLFMGLRAAPVWLLLFACLNGAGQSTGWSGLVKTMAIWFGRETRGVVMAWWGTNYVFGGFVATAFATWAIGQHWILPQLGWRLGFFLPALVLLAIAVLFLTRMKDPADAPNAVPEPERSPKRTTELQSSWSELVDLLRKPSLWMVSVSYFFLELCRYALMFWLPLYMVERLKYSVEISGYVSSLYELVGIVGAVAAGYASDRFAQSRRAPVAALMLWGLACVMLTQPALGRAGVGGTAIAIALAGILSYGPDTLLSGACAQDIGEAKAAATASGFVDGIGHLGALFSPYVVVYVSERYGWDRLFPLFAAVAVLAGAALLPMWNLTPAACGETPVRAKTIEQTS